MPGVLVADALSFVFAAVITGVLRIPKTPPEPDDAPISVLEEATAGFKFIFQRPGLTGLILTHAMFNFTLSFTARLVTPLVLARTGDNAAALGFVAAAFGVGLLAGGLVMGAWGGLKNRVHGVLIGFVLAGLFEQMLMGFGQTVLVWALANFMGGFVSSFYEGSYFAIWQSKTPSAMQGRVFSAMMLVLQGIAPIAYLTAGVYADRLFQPLASGPLGTALEPWLGVGPGVGYALMFVAAGGLSVLVGLSGYLRPGVVTLERDLPDATPEPEAPQVFAPDPHQTLEFVWDFESPDRWDFGDDDDDSLEWEPLTEAELRGRIEKGKIVLDKEKEVSGD